jgi:enoyl-CoA hydratase/carnithine racemase
MIELPPGLAARIEDGVLHVLLDHGDENLFSTEMCRALTETLLDPPQDAHVMHLQAAGSVFCLGRERIASDPESLRDEVGALIALNQAFASSRLLTVAEVQGDAAGFGVAPVALSDHSIIAPSARLWFPEVRIGIAPSIVLVWLARIVGRRRALLLTATGQEISAERAVILGLAGEVAPSDDEVSKVAAEEVARLCALSPSVHADIKRFLNTTADLPEAEAYELAHDELVRASLPLARGTSDLSR